MGESPTLISEKMLASQLFELHYSELLAIARKNRQRLNAEGTLETSDVLHESYFRLTGKSSWECHSHFFATVTLAIRHAIIDYARKKTAQKRIDKSLLNSFEDEEKIFSHYAETPEEVLAISDLLNELNEQNPRWVSIVTARYFCGLTESETARAMELSSRTIRREWKEAKLWIKSKLDHNSDNIQLP